MAIADPYVQPIPRSVAESRDEDLKSWFEYDNRWKHDIWQKLGGGGDNIDQNFDLIAANENQIDFLKSYISFLTEKINDLESTISFQEKAEKEYFEVNVSSVYTAADREEVNATQSAVITLPTSGFVKVNNIDGSLITINLSGSQTIFGESSVILQQKGSVVFKYLVESDQWVFE